MTSRWQSFATEMLAQEENFAGRARLNRRRIGKAEAVDSRYRTTLHMDSTEVPVYGEREQSPRNGSCSGERKPPRRRRHHRT